MKDFDLDAYSKEIDGRYESSAGEIVKILMSPLSKMYELVTNRSVIVVCGPSGCGKSRSIERANEKLPDGEGVAESLDILHCKDVDEAVHILTTDNYYYEGARHIAYSIVNMEIGNALLERSVFPVVFIK